MDWKPIIDDQKAEVIKVKLAEIAETLMQLKDAPDEKKEGVSLTGGKTGLALFFFYYAKLTTEEKYYDFALDLFSDIFEEINNGFSYHTLSGGIAGIGWSFDHLIKEKFIEADADETLNDIDPYLGKAMLHDVEQLNYDFLHGAIGNGVYFLSRLHHDSSKEFLTQLIDGLERISIPDPDGSYKWKKLPYREDEKDKTIYDLGLAHGLASFIAFLGKVYEQGINTEKTLKLLTGSVQYMLKQELDTKVFLSYYPFSVIVGEPPTGSRLAWCYGDLGIATSLWQAAKSTKNKQWEEKAVEILLHSARRRDLMQNMVVDAGLCHGAAGMALIFNRLYFQLKNEEFKDAAIYWIEQTLMMAGFADGYAGFKAWHAKDEWVKESGLLEGIAGIGLAFISAISDIEPKWDRCLLLS